MDKNELYNTVDDKLLDKDKEPDLSFKVYEISQETLCKAFQKAHSLLHPTKEQAKWWTDHKKEIDDIMCLNLKPEDSLCEYVDRELRRIHNERVNLDIRRRNKNRKN